MSKKSAAVSGTQRYSGRREENRVYTYGNAARELKPEYDLEAQRSRIEEHRRRQRVSRQKREQSLRMDLPYLLMLTAATIAALLICCSYVRVRSDLTARMHRIETQEKELEALKNKNDTQQTEINTAVDLDKIYERATQELGMVYAGRNQIIRYKKTESEYVRQYEDIPGENKQ